MNNMPKIYIRTYAYNAEKTIERTILSVLNQTYTNFEYYLCDNGSTDKTGEIIEKYAKQDARIKPFRNNINRNFLETEECIYLPYNIADDEYFCILDADDEYTADFFEKMLAFAMKYSLDMVACGNYFVDAATNKIVSKREIKQSIILDNPKAHSDLFAQCHQFFRTTWGKLFSSKVTRVTIQIASEIPEFPKAYGGDTYNVFLSIKASERIGILNEILHKYYVSKKTVSYKWIDGRIETDRTLHKAAFDFLHTKAGYVTQRNHDFLLCVYINAIEDTLRVLLNAKLSIKDKISGVIDIFSHKYTIELLTCESIGVENDLTEQMKNSKKQILTAVANWMLTLEEVPDELMESFCKVGSNICAASENVDGWVRFEKLNIQFLSVSKHVDEAVRKAQDLLTLLPNDTNSQRFVKMIKGQS